MKTDNILKERVNQNRQHLEKIKIDKSVLMKTDSILK